MEALKIVTHEQPKFVETLTRQLDLIPLEVLSKSITIIGAGAVGSWTALALVKMGFTNLTVWDDDEVSVENMNCQMYPIHEIGFKKVSALKTMIDHFTGITIAVRDERYTGSLLTDNIVISGLDCMKGREDIFNNFKGEWLIDPRMAAEKMLMYVVNNSDLADRDSYEKSLYSNEDAVQEACTAKSTIYCPYILSGMVANAVKNVACGQKYQKFMDFNLTGKTFMGFAKDL